MNKLILFLFILISCQKHERFYEKSLERWVYAYEINMTNFAKKLSAIPENTWLPLLEIKIMGGNYHQIKDCLFYHWDGKVGQIKFLHDTYSCDDPFLDGDVFKDIQIKEITRSTRLTINTSQGQWDYPLVNVLKNDSIPYSREKFSPGVNETLFPGVMILAPFAQKKFKRPSLPDQEICHDVDDECNEVVNYQCHLCKNGWTSEIHGNCSRTFRKRCGQNNCGGKGQIACLRGFKVTGFSLDFCFPDSPIAFCQEGFRVVCKEKTLYCD